MGIKNFFMEDAEEKKDIKKVENLQTTKKKRHYGITFLVVSFIVGIYGNGFLKTPNVIGSSASGVFGITLIVMGFQYWSKNKKKPLGILFLILMLLIIFFILWGFISYFRGS